MASCVWNQDFKNRKLEFHDWLVAWDTYALLAAALEQLSFKAAMQYKQVVAQAGASLHNVCAHVQCTLLCWYTDCCPRWCRTASPNPGCGL